jgi:hypothetical protein
MSNKLAGKKKQSVPVVERVAELAMQLGQRHLADYGAVRSRKDFTQRQLMSCLVLKAYLKTTYRGVLDLLKASDQLRARLGMIEKVPHYTTLQKFSARSRVAEIATAMVLEIGRRAAVKAAAGGGGAPVAAVDATGLARTTVSDYFVSRRGHKVRRWVKLSVMVLCGSLMPIALVTDLRPTHDCHHAVELLAQTAANGVRPAKLYADRGYDAEWFHEHCRQQCAVPVLIPPVHRRKDGSVGGRWRSQMTAEYLQQQGYNTRWTIESFFSALKRTMGGGLSARRPDQMLCEASIKVLAYALRR